MKTLIRFCLIIPMSLVFSFAIPSCSHSVCSVIYTVLGIMFSVAMSLTMSFSFTEVSNPAYVTRQRKQIKEIRFRFIAQFIISTAMFLLSAPLYYREFWALRFNSRAFVLAFLSLQLVYFIVNFLDLSDLKDSIEDEIRESQNKK